MLSIQLFDFLLMKRSYIDVCMRLCECTLVWILVIDTMIEVWNRRHLFATSRKQ